MAGDRRLGRCAHRVLNGNDRIYGGNEGGLRMEDFEGVEGLDICHKYGNEIVECEAQGGEWISNPSGRFCSIDGVSHTLFCGYPDPGGCDSLAVTTESVTELTHVESATAGPAPSAPLLATDVKVVPVIDVADGVANGVGSLAWARSPVGG